MGFESSSQSKSPLEEAPKPEDLAAQAELQLTVLKYEAKENEPRIHQGSWEFRGEHFQDVQISGDFKTLYYFLQNKLGSNKDFARLPSVDKRDYLIGVIELARKYNPDVNLDDFESYKGKTLLLPTELIVAPRFNAVLVQGSEGTRRLEELAEYDGFEVTDPAAQERIYRDSLANTVTVPESPYYARKENNGESPNQLYPETIKRFEEMAEEFSTLEFGGVTGWGLVYTDALRDLDLQQKTYAAKGRSTYKSTTHTTGCAVDCSIGRLRHPTLGEVTYSDRSDPKHPVPSKEWAPIIEPMWPEMERLALKHGFVVYREGDHLHLYAPKGRKLEGLFDGAQNAVASNE